MSSDTPHTPPEEPRSQVSQPAAPVPAVSHLRPLRIKGSILAWALTGIAASGAGLLLITGLSGTPWLFLLYPLLIGLLLASLGALALHLLHKF